MFTGLIKEVGVVTGIQQITEGKMFTFFSTVVIDDLKKGDSVCVNGVCLTVTHLYQDVFCAQAVETTLQKSNLGYLKTGDKVSLEPALRLSDRLGGHLVQGHVNGLAELVRTENQGNNYNLWLRVPGELLRYMVLEGSVALDGVSLTLADIREDHICVTIIPHTWTHTHFAYKNAGDLFNVEVDLMAKYAEKLLAPKKVIPNFKNDLEAKDFIWS
ncbi:MAG: riboflavin synthase [Bacteriovoracaceae bacterium]|nr:riboflavin synthase [Bacteriovoracaceae bacterium]